MISPSDSINKFGIHEGDRVADFGVGYGKYAYALSDRVKEAGRVFAVDIQKNLLSRLKKEAQEKGIKNIEIIWGDVEISGGTKLRKGSLDAVVVANILSQIDDRNSLVSECFRVLKPKGRLLLIDWLESSKGIGPGIDLIVDKETAKNFFRLGNFEYRKDIDAGEYHYGLVFEKK